MVIGDPGRAGHPAASHVAQEQDLDPEAVIIPNLLVMEKVAQDLAQKQKTVTHNVAQVEKIMQYESWDVHVNPQCCNVTL